MKRKTLLALGVMGALGMSGASAATFLCETPSDLSYTVCAPAAFEPPPSAVILLVPEPAIVSYSSVVPARPYVASARLPEPYLTVTTYDYSGVSWPQTEPRISTYRYYYGR